MAKISKISPDGGTTVFDLKDKDAQTKTLTTPIEVDGESQTTVEDALSAINNKSGGGSISGTTPDTDNIMLVTANEM